MLTFNSKKLNLILDIIIFGNNIINKSIINVFINNFNSGRKQNLSSKLPNKKIKVLIKKIIFISELKKNFSSVKTF
jgi:hypothetical protein